MSLSIGGMDSYPGSSLSPSQLFDAIKQKLRGPKFDRRFTTTVDSFEVDRLEQDALEVLRLARSVKNSFAPINRIPPELLCLITRYLNEDGTLTSLTHVCHCWREILTAYPSLWTRLECKSLDKTRVYIERSKSSPLMIVLNGYHEYRDPREAFYLVTPHISRVGSITVSGGNAVFQTLKTHFSCPVPHLRNLDINLTSTSLPVLNCALFNGDLSSLCKLRLSGVNPHLPWKNLPNLTSFTLERIPRGMVSVVQLLDFFTNTTFLSEIKLDLTPSSSDAPPGRVVLLPYLKSLIVLMGQEPSSIFLNHLTIPLGASLHLGFELPRTESLLKMLLPGSSDNLQNISCITSAYFNFSAGGVSIQLNGPSGKFYLRGGNRNPSARVPPTLYHIFSQCVDYFALSKTKKLGITMYRYEPFVFNSPSRFILGAMEDLRILFLDWCDNLPFALALNPDENPSEPVLCPKLESLVLYIKEKRRSCIRELVTMAGKRASKGVRLKSITLVSRRGLSLEEELCELEKYVERVKYRFGRSSPKFDAIPEDGGEW